MLVMTESEFFTSLDSLPYLVERWSEGTVRFALLRPHSTRDIVVGDVTDLAFDHCYLIGREDCPTLSDLEFSKTTEIETALAQHRYLRIDTSDELQSAISLLQRFGWSVDNDAYILDSAARWLMYVSHHDKIHLEEPVA